MKFNYQQNKSFVDDNMYILRLKFNKHFCCILSLSATYNPLLCSHPIIKLPGTSGSLLNVRDISTLTN